MQCCSWLLLLACVADAASSATPNAVRSSTGGATPGNNFAKDQSEESANASISVLRDTLKAKGIQASRAQLEVQRLSKEAYLAAEAAAALQTQVDHRKEAAKKTVAKEHAEQKVLEDAYSAKLEKMMATKQDEVRTMEELIKNARKSNAEQARKLAQAEAKAKQRMQKRNAMLKVEEEKIVASLANREASSKKRAVDSLVPIKKQLSSTEVALKAMHAKHKELDKPFADRRADLEAETSAAQESLQSHTAQLRDALQNMRKNSAEMLESDRVELHKLTEQKKELEASNAAVKKQLEGLDSKINTLHVKTAMASKRITMAEQKQAAAQRKFLEEQRSRAAATDTESEDNAQVMELEQRFHETHARKVHKVQALRHQLSKLHEVEDATLEQTANLRGHA